MGIGRRIRDMLNHLFFEVDEDATAPAASVEDARRAEAKKTAHLALLRGLEACEAGQFDTALDQFQGAFIAFRLVEDSRSSALVQKTQALVISCIKDPKTIRAAYKRAAMMLRQAGLKDEEVRTLLRSADFEAGEREFRDAYGIFKNAVSLCRDRGDHLGQVESLGRYARVEADRGKVSEATQMVEEALACAEASGDAACVELAKAWEARILKAEGGAEKPAA